MLQPKQFILDEAKNVRRILTECLRHDYGSELTKEFYGEVRRRLDRFDKDTLSKLPDGNLVDFEKAAKALSELSTCIALIERSHLGEFSWAFGKSLIALARKICVEQGPASQYGPIEPQQTKESGQEEPIDDTPIFHISADGGLGSYKIIHDSEIFLLVGTKRIFHVVFPRAP